MKSLLIAFAFAFAMTTPAAARLIITDESCTLLFVRGTNEDLLTEQVNDALSVLFDVATYQFAYEDKHGFSGP